MGMFDGIRPLGWGGPALVSEVRELRTKDQSRVWGYGVKLVGRGITVECAVTDMDLGKSLGAGMEIEVVGEFEAVQGGSVKPVLKSFKPIGASGKASSAA